MKRTFVQKVKDFIIPPEFGPQPFWYRWIYYFEYLDNWHKAPAISWLMCKMGRHDMIPYAVYQDGKSVYMKCFYCDGQGSCGFVSQGKNDYTRMWVNVPVRSIWEEKGIDPNESQRVD